MREFFETVWNQSVPLSTEIASIKSGRKTRPRARVICGREEIFKQIAKLQLQTTQGISEITTLNGPVRIVRRMEKEIFAPRKDITWRILCHMNLQNFAEMKKLKSVADLRHLNRPFGIGIIIFDSSEALIHYIHPDSPDLATTAADVAMDTTDPSLVKNLLWMFDSVWQNAVPIDRKLRKITHARSTVSARI